MSNASRPACPARSCKRSKVRSTAASSRSRSGPSPRSTRESRRSSVMVITVGSMEDVSHRPPGLRCLADGHDQLTADVGPLAEKAELRRYSPRSAEKEHGALMPPEALQRLASDARIQVVAAGFPATSCPEPRKSSRARPCFGRAVCSVSRAWIGRRCHAPTRTPLSLDRSHPFALPVGGYEVCDGPVIEREDSSRRFERVSYAMIHGNRHERRSPKVAPDGYRPPSDIHLIARAIGDPPSPRRHEEEVV